MKTKTWLTSCCFVILATMSVSSFAMYVGNPTRPDTIVVPAHCENGCWRETYYVKYLNPPVKCGDVRWVEGSYDRSGNWVPAHWQPRAVTVVGSY